jgi:hypothetical protein
MPTLSELLSPAFKGGSRKRGQDLFRNRAATIASGGAMSAEATVVGTDIYYVDIDIHDKGVFVCCTCPYYMDEWEPCKHIWATLLTAESKGMLVGNGEPIAPRLLLEEVEIRLPKGGVITGFGSSFSPVPAGSAVPPKPASVPQWKLTLQRVGSLAAPPVQRTGYGVPTPATWPAGRALS